MKIEGGCHCGSITYEAEIDPKKVGICHCTNCQTLTGSAFTTSISAAKGAFSLRTGQAKIYLKTAESGAKRAQAFCPECGSRIYAETQSWRRSALGWVMDLGSVKPFAQVRPR